MITYSALIAEGVILHYLCLNKMAISDMGSLCSQVSEMDSLCDLKAFIFSSNKTARRKGAWGD